MNNSIKSALAKAHKFVVDAKDMGFDLTDILTKIEKAIELTTSDVVTIALLGSVSDGKTTTISGLIGQQLANMKIDTNESSDEIEIYEVPFLDKTFRFVDTPGLFGTREKMLDDGRMKRFSDLTTDYIAQANIVIYVTEVSNPLPESHQPMLRYVMRDLRKLDNAIFIINKMDQKYDTLDDEEFAEGVDIKRQNLMERLQRCLELSADETNRLSIICIAADPNEKGLPYWFANPQAYLQRSHIVDLKNWVIKATQSINGEESNAQAAIDTAADALNSLSAAIDCARTPIKKALQIAEPLYQDSKDQLQQCQKQLLHNKAIIKQELDILENNVRNSIASATVETFGNVIDSEIGRSEEGIDFAILCRKIDSAFAICSERVNSIQKESFEKIADKIESADKMVDNAMKDGVMGLKNVNISPEFVGKMRDMFFKDFKFKPWGKINMAKNFNKWLGRATMGLGFALEAYGWYKKWKANKDLAKLKDALQSKLNEIFSKAHSYYYENDAFIANFAPGFIEMEKALAEKNKEIEALQARINEMEERQAEIRLWKKGNIDDIDYTTI